MLIKLYKLELSTSMCRVDPSPYTFTSFAEILPQHSFDVIIFLTKAHDLKEAITQALPHLRENGVMVFLQNGMIDEVIENILVKERIVRGILSFGGMMTSPGRYSQNTSGPIYLGSTNTLGIQMVIDILHPTFKIHKVENLEGLLWAKLVINCSLNGLSAVTGVMIGSLFEPPFRSVLMKIHQEVLNLADHLNIEIMPLEINTLIQKQEFKTLEERYVNSKASTLQSLERKRKSEVEFINGYIVRKANELGLQSPMNKIIYEL
ncbi:MAG: ketopantoate reductase family protein, partial [Candidatus Kariarchaeaceae archaeon]